MHLYDDDRPLCQVCFKKGHTAGKCWFDKNYVPDPMLVVAATSNSSSYAYNIDTNWYTDTGATYHITGELEKLTLPNKYNGGDQIHTANGAGLNISHIGHTTVCTPNCDIHLKNVLYVP